MVVIIGMSAARRAEVRAPEPAAAKALVLLVGRVIPARCSRWRVAF